MAIHSQQAPAVQAQVTKKTLLIVDDEPQVIKSIVRTLRKQDLEILTACSAEEAIKIIQHNAVGVVLSDQNMPSMDGVSFLAKVREYDRDIVRLLLTGFANVENAIEAINRSQIFEFLTKPWEPEALQSALSRAFDHHKLKRENRRLHLVAQEQNAQLLQLNDTLERRVKDRTVQLADAVRQGVLMLSLAAEARDDNTGEHVKRIQHLTQAICLKIGMTKTDADRIGFFSMMHDVGKIHIPDKIINKNGPLTDKEWQVMQEHTIVGEKILCSSPYYSVARQIARSHHEWMDGSGYPDGLRGVNIPLVARIVAVADVFDALTHTRPYKKAWPRHKAIEEINRLAGRQFDTDIVDAFVEIFSEGLNEAMET